MKGKTISIINMKGGVGKTTLTVNLAHYLSKKLAQKILLIDFDPQANATSALINYEQYKEHKKKKSMISEIFSDVRNLVSPTGKETKEKILSMNDLLINVYNGNDGGKIDLIPSELELSNILERASGSNMEERLDFVIKDKKKAYDYVLIDCSPTYSVLTNNALNTSNFVLIPVKPDPFSARGIPMLLEKIDVHNQFREQNKQVGVLGIVFNMVKDSRYIDSIKAEIFRSHRGVFETEIRFTENYPIAFFENKSILESRAQNQFKDNFSDFAEEFVQKIEVKSSEGKEE